MRELNSNSILILNTINMLSNEDFIQKVGNNGLFISRHLVKQTLLNKYKISLELDTIYRHFRILHFNNLLNYFRGSSWKDCFILSVNKIKDNFFCDWKKEVILTLHEIEDIFNHHSKNKLLKYEKEYLNFQDYYKNNGFKFKVRRVLINKWVNWCKRIHPTSLDISTFSYLNFKKYGTKNVFNLWQANSISKNMKFFEIEKAVLNFSNYSKMNKKMTIKTNTSSTHHQEKAAYKWEFRKAKNISDKIKNWLEFELKLNWMDLFYWKDIKEFEIKTNQGILKLAWEEKIHPDFNKNEILLFNVDTNKSRYLLDQEYIDTVEVIENV